MPSLEELSQNGGPQNTHHNFIQFLKNKIIYLLENTITTEDGKTINLQDFLTQKSSRKPDGTLYGGIKL